MYNENCTKPMIFKIEIWASALCSNKTKRKWSHTHKYGKVTSGTEPNAETHTWKHTQRQNKHCWATKKCECVISKSAGPGNKANRMLEINQHQQLSSRAGQRPCGTGRGRKTTKNKLSKTIQRSLKDKNWRRKFPYKHRNSMEQLHFKTSKMLNQFLQQKSW